jgi:sugar lactone lactonase YvrE
MLTSTTCNILKFVAVCFLAGVLGCGQKQTVIEPANACAGVSCSNQGSCAVVNGKDPLCVCKAGFFAEGLECKTIVAGAECNGVTCNGLGVCLVIAGTPNTPKCECNADAVSAGATTCLARALPDGGGGGGAGGGGAGGGGVGPCEGVACSGRGQCAVIGGTTAVCLCSPGYVASSLTCVLQGTVGGDLTMLAGALGGPGTVDGTMNTRFESPESVTHDANGNVYVGGQNIRKITPSGSVSTLAGLAGVGNSGAVDGVGAAARFTFARFPVVDRTGNIFVSDAATIRKVTPSGVVSTVLRGFAGVFGLAIDANDALWASGFCTNSEPCLRKVTPGGVVSTLTLTTAPGVTLTRVYPGAIAVSADGNTAFMTTEYGDGFSMSRGADVVTVDTNTGSITALLGIATPDNTWNGTRLAGLCREGSNTLWVADETWGRIWRVPTTGGRATLIAGDSASTNSVYNGNPLHIDGPGATARFFGPSGLSCDQAAGKVYVADKLNHTIRAIATGGTNVVTTIAGTPIAIGAVDGTGGAARFRFPQQLVADSAGNWFVADSGNAVIRKVTPAGVVSVFAGSVGMPGSVDGTGTAARFLGTECWLGFGCYVIGLAIDSSDNLYVADRGRRIQGQSQREPDAIRKITPAGVVTTLASGNMVASNGVGAQFDNIAVDSTNGDVYFNAPDGIRRLRAGAIANVVPNTGRLSVAVDSMRRKLIVVVQSNGGQPRPPTVSRYDLSGATPVLESTVSSTMAPALGLLQAGAKPGQLAVAPNGAVAATFAESNVILRIDPTFSRVDKIAGEFDARGVELGPLPARLSTPTGVAFNAAGQFGIVMGRIAGQSGEGALLVTSGFTP